jgi:nitrogen fixation protein NifB
VNKRSKRIINTPNYLFNRYLNFKQTSGDKTMDRITEKQSNIPMRVAVASYEGVLVNMHLGMADYLLIFEITDKECRLVERRHTPQPGGGTERWNKMADLLGDCKALLAASIGPVPLKALSDSGLKIYEVDGLIEDALLDLYQGKELRMPQHRPRCRMADSGAGGQGCS